MEVALSGKWLDDLQIISMTKYFHKCLLYLYIWDIHVMMYNQHIVIEFQLPGNNQGNCFGKLLLHHNIWLLCTILSLYTYSSTHKGNRSLQPPHWLRLGRMGLGWGLHFETCVSAAEILSPVVPVIATGTLVIPWDSI